MEGVTNEIQNALSDIEKKLSEKSELSHKDLLTLLAKSLLDEEEDK